MIIFEHTAPTVLIWLAVLGTLAIVALSFLRYMKPNMVTIVLGVLRALFIALLAWCLFLPQLRKALTQTLKPRFVVAVDTSQSMDLSPSADVASRWTQAQQILEQPWARIIRTECDTDLYGFATELGSRIDLPDADALRPTGSATYLRDCLRKLADRYKGQNVTGLLLLSDGTDTREAYDDWAQEMWPWPIYSVRLEPPAAWEVEPDLRIDSVNTPRRVTKGWTTELKAVISGQGTKGQALNVQFLRNDVLLRESPTQIPATGGAKEIVFQIEHTEIGVFTYRVHAPPLPGESQTNDNTYAVSVQVIDTRNRALYVEGSPRWESKYVTRALQANQRVTPLCFVRGPNEQFLTYGNRGSMTAEMRPDQLAFFKIVVLGNLNAEELGEERPLSLVSFVDTGGSLVLLGGSKAWAEDGFGATELKRVMPVKNNPGAPVEGKYPTTVTDAGKSHPAFAGDDELWSVMPPVLSVFPGVSLSPAAQVLVAADTEQGPEAVVVAQRYGQGKVVAIFTDSLWRWKLSPNREDGIKYQRFWDQLLAWLSPAEEELDIKPLNIFADREQLYLGEEVEISARLGGDSAELAEGAEITCELTAPDGRVVPFAMSRQYVVTPSGKSFPGVAFSYSAEAAGLHTAVAITEIAGKTVKSDPLSFFVKPFTPESVPRAAKVDLLRTLGKASNGRFFDNREDLNETLAGLQFATEEEETVDYRSLSIPSGSHSLESILIITCLMAFLAIEWTVRKWQNMP